MNKEHKGHPFNMASFRKSVFKKKEPKKKVPFYGPSVYGVKSYTDSVARVLLDLMLGIVCNKMVEYVVTNFP